LIISLTKKNNQLKHAPAEKWTSHHWQISLTLASVLLLWGHLRLPRCLKLLQLSLPNVQHLISSWHPWLIFDLMKERDHVKWLPRWNSCVSQLMTLL